MSNAHEQYLSGLPSEWPRRRLGELGQIHSGSTPSRAVSGFWNGDIPWVTPGELTHLKEKYLDGTAECITRSGLASCGASLLPRDALLVTTRATIGSVALATTPIATNQGFKSLVLGATSSPDFYYHLFGRLILELVRRASGTTFLEIGGKQFAVVEVPCPPLPEQRRIAAILDTLDETIRHTEQVIEKLKEVKQGLLHDLLTRGIDDNGELRPPPDEAPHLYKDSPLGRIPRRWEVCSVGTTATLQRGVDLPIQSRNEGPIPVYGSNGVDGWHSRSPFVGPGVITGRSGSIGNVHFCEGPYWPLNTTLHVRDFHGNEPMWVVLLLTALRLERFTAATSVPSLNRNFVHPTQVGVPPREEQGRTLRFWAALTRRVSGEEIQLRKLCTLKNGLMDDLLTGRVRVHAADAGEDA